MVRKVFSLHRHWTTISALSETGLIYANIPFMNCCGNMWLSRANSSLTVLLLLPSLMRSSRYLEIISVLNTARLYLSDRLSSCFARWCSLFCVEGFFVGVTFQSYLLSADDCVSFSDCLLGL